MKFGNIEIIPVSDGSFRLDGGAMFGVVPKILWEKRIPADKENRIPMGLNCLLIRGNNKNILVNTGIGALNKYHPRFVEIYSMQHPPDLISSLAQQELKPDNIDLVVLTHLHFDHCGGNTKYSEADKTKLTPTFPNARYIVQKNEWEKAINPNERTRASYIKENLLPIQQSGQLDTIEGDKEIIPGVFTKVTGGHTRAHQIIMIKSNNQTAVYWSDLIPTTAHVDLPYIMSYDLYPEETLNEKRGLIEQAVKEKWLCFWEHDPSIVCGYIQIEADKFKVMPHDCV